MAGNISTLTNYVEFVLLSSDQKSEPDKTRSETLAALKNDWLRESAAARISHVVMKGTLENTQTRVLTIAQFNAGLEDLLIPSLLVKLGFISDGEVPVLVSSSGIQAVRPPQHPSRNMLRALHRFISFGNQGCLQCPALCQCECHNVKKTQS